MLFSPFVKNWLFSWKYFSFFFSFFFAISILFSLITWTRHYNIPGQTRELGSLIGPSDTHRPIVAAQNIWVRWVCGFAHLAGGSSSVSCQVLEMGVGIISVLGSVTLWFFFGGFFGHQVLLFFFNLAVSPLSAIFLTQLPGRVGKCL